MFNMLSSNQIKSSSNWLVYKLVLYTSFLYVAYVF